MKETLLSIVQDILSDMDSDLVNSINDTPEALQVAQIVKRTYYDLLNTREWQHFQELGQLDAASVARPTHMPIPSEVKKVESISYDKAKTTDTSTKYSPVRYLYPDEFLTLINNRRSDANNIITVIDPSGVPLLIATDSAPEHWTSFDDSIVVMDSYDSDVDTFLQNSKTQTLMLKEPEFILQDDFVPDWPSEAFTLLIAESKSRAFLALAQEVNEKAEQQSQRARKFLATNNWQAAGGIRYTSYGRVSKK